MRTPPDKDLLFGSLLGFAQTFDAWIHVILDEQKYPKNLRRNAIAIWLSALVEFLSKAELRVNAAKNLNVSGDGLADFFSTLDLLEKGAKEILTLFTEDEQIMIWMIRNTALHGHLSLYYHDALGIRTYNPDADSILKLTKTRVELALALEQAVNINPRPTERLKTCPSFQLFQTMYVEHLSSSAIERYHKALFGWDISTF